MSGFTKFVCAKCGPHFGASRVVKGQVLCLEHAKLAVLQPLPRLPGLPILVPVTKEEVVTIEKFRLGLRQAPPANEEGGYAWYEGDGDPTVGLVPGEYKGV